MEHLIGSDARLAGVIRSVGPWLIPQKRDPFAALCWSMVHQQVSLKAAAAIYERFAGLCARKRPTPAAVLALTDAQFRQAGFSRQKVAYVRDLAEHFADGRLRPSVLRRSDDAAVLEAVTRVRGIGRWTAEMLLMFSLGRLDVLPVGDFGLRSAVRLVYRTRGLPTPERITRLAKPWRPYRSVATWYLWRSLGVPKPAEGPAAVNSTPVRSEYPSIAGESPNV
jgi:DNA-3-methyladenine glycosylase II